MNSELLVGILGLAVGGIVGFVGPIYTARAAAKRQTEQLTHERERLELNLAADRLKTLIEERRKLLDQGALLLIEIDEGLRRLMQGPLGEGEESDDDTRTRDWDQCVKALTRFRTRLTLWFDEGSEVIEAFTAVLDEVSRQNTSVAGQLRTNAQIREHLAELDDADGPEHLAALAAKSDAIADGSHSDCLVARGCSNNLHPRHWRCGNRGSASAPRPWWQGCDLGPTGDPCRDRGQT